MPSTTPRPQILRDPGQAAAFASDGWVKIPFLDPAGVSAVAAAIAAAQCGVALDDHYVPPPMRLSCFHRSGDYRRRLFAGVEQIIRDPLERALPGYRVLVVNLIQKLPYHGVFDGLAIHQNPSFVAEPEHKSVSVWVPLQDTDRENGTVGILRGSQDVIHPVRAVNMPPEMWAPVHDALVDDYFDAVATKAGEAVVIDDSTIHWSYPNRTDRMRTAVQLICVPDGVPLTYSFYVTDDGPPRLDGFRVDKEYFFRFQYHLRPTDIPLISQTPYVYPEMTEAELARLVGPKNPELLRRIAARRARTAAAVG